MVQIGIMNWDGAPGIEYFDVSDPYVTASMLVTWQLARMTVAGWGPPAEYFDDDLEGKPY